MENGKETVELNKNQLEAVAGGDCAQWKVIGYCPQCKEKRYFFCSMYPGEGPFDCNYCHTQLTDARVEEY